MFGIEGGVPGVHAFVVVPEAAQPVGQERGEPAGFVARLRCPGAIPALVAQHPGGPGGEVCQHGHGNEQHG